MMFEVYQALTKTARAFERAWEWELMPLGISPVEAEVLLAVDAAEVSGVMVSSSSLAQDIFREPHSVSGLLKRMMQRGLVRRAKAPGGNIKRVSLTKKGQELCEKVKETHTMQVVSGDLPDAQAFEQTLRLVWERALDELTLRQARARRRR